MNIRCSAAGRHTHAHGSPALIVALAAHDAVHATGAALGAMHGAD